MQTDEEVVRAAFPNLYVGAGTGFIYADDDTGPRMGNNWKEARKHFLVQEWEAKQRESATFPPAAQQTIREYQQSGMELGAECDRLRKELEETKRELAAKNNSRLSRSDKMFIVDVLLIVVRYAAFFTASDVYWRNVQYVARGEFDAALENSMKG